IGQFMRAVPQIIEIEHPLSQSPEEAGCAVLRHFAPRAEQWRPRQKRMPNVDQIMLIPTRPVEEQQHRCRSPGLRARLKAVDEAEPILGLIHHYSPILASCSGGKIASTSARRSSSLAG